MSENCLVLRKSLTLTLKLESEPILTVMQQWDKNILLEMQLLSESSLEGQSTGPMEIRSGQHTLGIMSCLWPVFLLVSILLLVTPSD